MLKVTKVYQEKDAFYQVSFDNGQQLRVSEDLLVRFRLLKGMEVDEQTLAEIKQSAGYDVGLQLAMRYISYQLRTEQEVRKYLKEKMIASADQNKIMQRLQELQLIDDLNYGQSYVRTQLRLSDKGPAVMKQQLQRKGLREDAIQAALELYSSDEQFAIAFRTANKMLKTIRGKSHKETLQKLRTNLMQKGFSTDIIQLVMSELPTEKDEDVEWEALQKEGAKLLRRHHADSFAQKKNKIKQKLYQRGFDFDLI